MLFGGRVDVQSHVLGKTILRRLCSLPIKFTKNRDALHKHLCANTAVRNICPILSHHVYIFTNSYERERSNRTVFTADAEISFCW
jgi:hypothetical protein